jgi:hypothetical protein
MQLLALLAVFAVPLAVAVPLIARDDSSLEWCNGQRYDPTIVRLGQRP